MGNAFLRLLRAALLVVFGVVLFFWINSSIRPWLYVEDHRRVLRDGRYRYIYVCLEMNSGGLYVKVARRIESGVLAVLDSQIGDVDARNVYTPDRRYPDMVHEWGGAGYRYIDSGDSTLRVQDVEVLLPIWAVECAALLLPTSSLTGAWRKRRRHQLQLCATCGYDLRATLERCPECGARPT